jgi:hypothetical protein
MDSQGVTTVMTCDHDAIVRRIYAGVEALAEPRRACASRTRELFKRGGALGGEGFLTRYLDLVVDQNKMHLYEKTGELRSALSCLEIVGVIDGHGLTSLGEALLPILSHEGMSSQFVWYVLWINLSCTWLGAMAWNMLTRQGSTIPLLTEALCSYLCGEDAVDSQDRGAASSLENSFQNTVWGDLGIGEAPAHGRRLWLRTISEDVDPLLVLYGLYKAANVSMMPTIDGEQLATLPYGPCVTLGIDGTTAVHQLLSLWLPGLLAQRREGDGIMFSVQTDKDACDVVREYARRRGYQ